MTQPAAPDYDVEELTDHETELEPPVRVLIHNDDVTPMDFVVGILTSIFQLLPQDAVEVMWRAHTAGLAHVATLPKTEAEKKVGKAHFAASLEGFPLTFSIEPE